MKRFLKPQKSNNNYLYVNLYKDGKRKKCYIHRLVAETYLPNLDNLPQVSHIDETRDNNCVDNLCWTTVKENNNMPLRLQRHSKRVKCIETGITYNSIKEAAIKNNVSKSGICSACNGKQKTSAGYHWAYYYEENEKEEI